MHPLWIATPVNTCAFKAVADPSWSTVAFEAPGRVGAGGVSVTVVGSNLTLIDICQRGERREENDTALMIWD